MHLKHMLAASAIAVSIGISPVAVGAGIANADPCNTPNCQPGGPNAGPGPSSQPEGGPQQGAQNGPSRTGPLTNGPQTGAQPNGPQGAPPSNGPQSVPPAGPNSVNSPQQGPDGGLQQGHPADLPTGQWREPGQGAPPAPRTGDRGWNDGPPPGGPPRNWDGPPPPGGWDGAPPPGGWNRRWDRPYRDIDQGRFDHQPFDYNDYYAIPVYDPDFNQWGFWFFGIWIPL